MRIVFEVVVVGDVNGDWHRIVRRSHLKSTGTIDTMAKGNRERGSLNDHFQTVNCAGRSVDKQAGSKNIDSMLHTRRMERMKNWG